MINSVTDIERNRISKGRTASGVKYAPHSMMHKAIVQMEPTKLELLDGFERMDSGHKFIPEESNVRVILTGRDWSEKRLLIYGSRSSDDAMTYVDIIIDRIVEIGHDAELISGPVITNIAVNGDLGKSLQLETLVPRLGMEDIDAEYEPEQFPAAIVRIEDPPATFLLFSTGKFAIQGLSRFEDIEPAIHRIQSILDSIDNIQK